MIYSRCIYSPKWLCSVLTNIMLITNHGGYDLRWLVADFSSRSADSQTDVTSPENVLQRRALTIRRRHEADETEDTMRTLQL